MSACSFIFNSNDSYICRSVVWRSHTYLL